MKCSWWSSSCIHPSWNSDFLPSNPMSPRKEASLKSRMSCRWHLSFPSLVIRSFDQRLRFVSLCCDRGIHVAIYSVCICPTHEARCMLSLATSSTRKDISRPHYRCNVQPLRVTPRTNACPMSILQRGETETAHLLHIPTPAKPHHGVPNTSKARPIEQRERLHLRH